MFYSEHGQDQWLAENVFKDQHGGTFVEFGAIDGLITSNTLHFGRHKHWRGLLIEANPFEFAKIAKNRPDCVALNAAIADVSGFKDFAVCGVTGWSGLVEHLGDKNLQRMRATGEEPEIIKVRCMPLKDALSEFGMNRVDYMSIDIEGAEYAALKEFPFASYDIDVIDIENNYGDTKVPELMLKNGYEKITTIGINDIYRKVRK